MMFNWCSVWTRRGHDIVISTFILIFVVMLQFHHKAPVGALICDRVSIYYFSWGFQRFTSFNCLHSTWTALSIHLFAYNQVFSWIISYFNTVSSSFFVGKLLSFNFFSLKKDFETTLMFWIFFRWLGGAVAVILFSFSSVICWSFKSSFRKTDRKTLQRTFCSCSNFFSFFREVFVGKLTSLFSKIAFFQR